MAHPCSSESAAPQPYASEYEGYLGNYGSTMDRWYQRAALVVWPRDRDFTNRAEWLAKERRWHVHSRIDAAELPVRHETRRKGRPYTLVLTKSQALFELERQARIRDEADLEWLTGEWKLAW